MEEPPPSIYDQLCAMNWVDFLEGQEFPAPYGAEAAGFLNHVMNNRLPLSWNELLGYEALLPDESPPDGGGLSKMYFLAFPDAKDLLRVSILDAVTGRRCDILKSVCLNVTSENANAAFETITILIRMFQDDASKTEFQTIVVDAMQAIQDVKTREALRDLMRKVCDAVDSWKSFYEPIDWLYAISLKGIDALVELDSMMKMEIENVTKHDANKIMILIPNVTPLDWTFPIGQRVSHSLWKGDVWKTMVHFDKWLGESIKQHVPKPSKSKTPRKKQKKEA